MAMLQYTKLLCIHTMFAVIVAVHATTNLYEPEVETNPSSLLVPTGTTAVFECKVHHCPWTCSIHWIINGSSTAHGYQQDQFEGKGFIFSHQHNTTSDVYAGKLAVTASVRVNNTELCCLVQDGINPSRKSSQATLLVISEPPLILNPSVRIQNSTSFLLEWSPPFLWPGQRIKYFNITVTKINDVHFIHRIVNLTFNDAVVSLIIELDAFEQQGRALCICTEFLFKIFAIGFVQLPTFNVTGRYLSSCSVPEFAVTDINTTILFTRKLKPIIMINIKLPSLICSHQTVNYTITIANNTVNLSNYSMDYNSYGPYVHNGPGMISHDITSGIERDKEYSASVTVRMESKVIQSHGVTFSTATSFQLQCTDGMVQDTDVFYYKLSIGLCLSVMFTILVILTTALIWKLHTHSLRMKHGGSSHDRTMVHNPIYDGPQYESVKPPTAFEILTQTTDSGVLEPAATKSTFTHQICCRNVGSFATSDSHITMSPPTLPTGTQVA